MRTADSSKDNRTASRVGSRPQDAADAITVAAESDGHATKTATKP
jgi:hypothetical protein